LIEKDDDMKILFNNEEWLYRLAYLEIAQHFKYGIQGTSMTLFTVHDVQGKINSVKKCHFCISYSRLIHYALEEDLNADIEEHLRVFRQICQNCHILNISTEVEFVNPK